MLQEPFWLGLITVFVVLAVIGLVWCAKRHFPEKIEKLLAEEADRNRRKCFSYIYMLRFDRLKVSLLYMYVCVSTCVYLNIKLGDSEIHRIESNLL